MEVHDEDVIITMKTDVRTGCIRGACVSPAALVYIIYIILMVHFSPRRFPTHSGAGDPLCFHTWRIMEAVKYVTAH